MNVINDGSGFMIVASSCTVLCENCECYQ
jgi:hypothetical protein